MYKPEVQTRSERFHPFTVIIVVRLFANVLLVFLLTHKHTLHSKPETRFVDSIRNDLPIHRPVNLLKKKSHSHKINVAATELPAGVL